MPALALENIVNTHFYVRLDSGLAEKETDHSLLLHATRQHTDSQTAVIYVVNPDTLEVSALTAQSTVPARLRDVGVTLSLSTGQWLESLPGVAQGQPASDPNFEKFPEALQYQVKRLAVVPLRTESRLLGLLTLGRLTETSFDSRELEVARSAGRLLTAVLERDTLQQKLVERKLVERAKGILQQRRRLSEEQAYLLLRNNSRRRRIPMAEVAKEIIEVTFVAVGAPGTSQRRSHAA